jgi:SAM-dependent methyltransferase
MTQQQPSKSPHAREYYNRAAGAVPEFTVLNYGFSSTPENSVIAPDEPEFYCLRLYEHTVGDTPLANRDVLEVSSGRGGGTHFVSRTYRPRRMIGVDLSPENVRLARARAGHSGIEFVVGNAEQLDLPDRSFDAVINIEASHLYDDRNRFFAEALRVLRPGGYFATLTAAGRTTTARTTCSPPASSLERLEITDNVIRALRRDSAAKRCSMPWPTVSCASSTALRRGRLSRLHAFRSGSDPVLLAPSATAAG